MTHFISLYRPLPDTQLLVYFIYILSIKGHKYLLAELKTFNPKKLVVIEERLKLLNIKITTQTREEFRVLFL